MNQEHNNEAEARARLTTHQRLLEVMREVRYVQKDTSVSGFGASYKAVSHDAVCAKVRPALINHGVLLSISYPEMEEEHLVVPGKHGPRNVYRATVKAIGRWSSVDSAADCIETVAWGTGEDSGDKAVGKAMSYAAKYVILKGLMLETGEDADSDASLPKESTLADLMRAAYRRDKDGMVRKASAAAGCDVKSPADVPEDKVEAVRKALKGMLGVPG